MAAARTRRKLGVRIDQNGMIVSGTRRASKPKIQDPIMLADGVTPSSVKVGDYALGQIFIKGKNEYKLETVRDLTNYDYTTKRYREKRKLVIQKNKGAKSLALMTGLYIGKDGQLRSNPGYDRETGALVSVERIVQVAEAAGLTVTNKPVKAKVAKQTLDPVFEAVISDVPESLKGVVTEILLNDEMNQVARNLMERSGDFDSSVAALLTGVLLDPNGRTHFDNSLDSRWQNNEIDVSVVHPEVIIGGGLHAAIYSSVRVAQGAPPPLVIEKSDRAGGMFASSRKAAFYLNSKNRPGPLSVPGMMGALNFLPGSLIQPSYLSGSEYQTNDSLAAVIRMALAMNANVVSKRRVSEITYKERMGKGAETYDLMDIFLEGGDSIVTKRIIIAAGIGSPIKLNYGERSDRMFTYRDFMSHMDDMFPFRGMNRVAVVGGGDGGKTVIEALTGQGPNQGLSVAAIDFPEVIDWYGAPAFTCEDFEKTQRSRYRSIARLLPSSANPNKKSRITPKGRALAANPGYDCVYVNEIPYDYVVEAVGFDKGRNDFSSAFAMDNFYVGDRIVAKQDYNYGAPVFTIGPNSNISVSTIEAELLAGVPENQTSIFRYAPRTAMLAASF